MIRPGWNTWAIDWLRAAVRGWPSARRGFGLRSKTILLSAFGLLLLFSLLGYVTDRTLGHSTNAALDEGLSQARAVAGSVDALISHVLQQMDNLAKLPGLQGNLQEQQQIVHDGFRVMSSVGALWLLDTQGRPLAQEPRGAAIDRNQVVYRTLALRTLQEGDLVVTEPLSDSVGQPAIAAIGAPVFGPDGEAHAVLVGEVYLVHEGGELVPLPEITSTSRFSIVGDSGDVIASTIEGEDYFHTDHIALLGPLIEDKQPGVKLHRSATAGDHVVAFAPLSATPGGVIFEEHDDLVLAIGQRLRRMLLVLGLATLTLASLAAWLYVRHVVRPILALRDAAGRIARGHLDEPVTVRRQDEIGDLAEAFDSMRTHLLEAQREHLHWEQELEDRVEAQAAQVKQLLGRVISAQEAERKRIARELHDGATQMVTTLLLQVEGMASALEPDSVVAIEVAPAARDYAARALEEIRRVILDLRPPALDDLGLVPGLRDYAEQRLGEATVRVDFRTEGEAADLDGNLEIAVYRIAQEAINNVASHSGANHASVTLEFKPDALRVVVEDNGVGFVLEEALKKTSGVGIAGMLERAEILGGHLSVLSTPGVGTRVSLEVPIERK